MSAHIWKLQRSQKNNVMIYLKLLEKEEQANPKEIIKIGAKKSMNWWPKEQWKNWFFEKINKINKALTKLIKRREGKTWINKITGEKGILQDTNEIQMIILNNLKTYTLANWKMKKK
jgi:hypothetical protein